MRLTLDTPMGEGGVMNRGFTKETIQRVARMYRSNQDASIALGITMRSFGRLCRKFGIETPYSKRLRVASECRQPIPDLGT